MSSGWGDWEQLQQLLRNKHPSYLVLEGAPSSLPESGASSAAAVSPQQQLRDAKQQQQQLQQQDPQQQDERLAQLRQLAASLGARVVLAPSPDSSSLLQQLVAQGTLDASQADAAAAAAAAGLDDLERLLLEGAANKDGSSAAAAAAAAESAQQGATSGVGRERGASGRTRSRAPSPSFNALVQTIFGFSIDDADSGPGESSSSSAFGRAKDSPDMSLRPSVGAPGASEERVRRRMAWRRGLAIASVLRWLDENDVPWRFIGGGGIISLGDDSSDDDSDSDADSDDDDDRRPAAGVGGGAGRGGDSGPSAEDRMRDMQNALRALKAMGLAGDVEEEGKEGQDGSGKGSSSGGPKGVGQPGPGGAAGQPGGGLLSRGEFDLVLEIGTGPERRLMRIKVDRDMRSYSSGSEASGGSGSVGSSGGGAAPLAAPDAASASSSSGSSGGGAAAAAAAADDSSGVDGGEGRIDVPSTRGRRGSRGPRGSRSSGRGASSGSGGSEGSGGGNSDIEKDLSSLEKDLAGGEGVGGAGLVVGATFVGSSW